MTSKKEGKLAEVKTKPTAASVEDFINAVESDQKRKDSFTLLEMMRKATGEEPRMWGPSIIGFGTYRYKSPATGREGDWMRIGFSPRKASISVYLTTDIHQYDPLLERLGKHKTGMGCLYINKLADVDMNVLKELVDEALKRNP